MSHALDPAVLHSFLEEVRSYLPSLEQEAARLREDGAAPEALAEIHRLAHSIRSACDMIGLESLAGPARQVEQLAAPALFGEHRLDEEGMAVLDGALEALKQGLGPSSGGPAEAAPASMPPPVTASSADEPVADFDPVAPDLLDTFLSEAEQLLERMDAGVASLRAQPASSGPILRDLRHHAHTLKGAAAMTGLETAARVAHRMEDLLDLLIAGSLPAEDEILDLLQALHDCLADLAAARGENGPLKIRVRDLLGQLDALLAICAEQSQDQPAAGGAPAGEEDPLCEREETDPFLLETFLAEAEFNLASAEAALRELSSRPADPQPHLQVFRRAVHTIKGSAGMVGLGSASTVARKLQFLLDGVLNGTVAYGESCLQAMTAGLDVIGELVDAQGENQALLDRAREVLDGIGAAASAAPAPAHAARPEAAAQPAARSDEPPPRQAAAEPQAAVRVPVDRLTGIARILSEIFMNASGFEQQIEAFRKELDELSLNLARMRRISHQLAETQESGAPGAGGPQAAHEATSSASEFDVLEFDRYTRMNLIARDLAEATADLSSLSAQLQSMRAQFDTWAARQRGLSGEAQDQLMRLRMVPLSSLANRLDRTVRVTAGKTGKSVRLELSGLETEFDKTVVEQLAPALEHLLRNAIDHGIEPPQERIAAGKPETGLIRLSASRQGAHVSIQLSDDGAGLDFRKIAQRAVELGWMAPQEAESASQVTLIRLIFEPGFSTADAVSEISGRGVGMDIVRSTIESLRGRLSVHTAPGAGTTFHFVLPVSMAVDRVIILEAGGEKFALPMSAMTRQMRVFDSQLVEKNGRWGVEADGQWLPACRLGEWLGVAAAEARPARCALLFVSNGEHELALLADRVIEAREVVIKPLSGLLARLRRFSGATILGDGSVVLILNPSALDLDPAVSAPVATLHRRAVREETILIVDDSISIRRSVANLLRAAGWRTFEARDGLEALEFLDHRASPPDAILMDIEMPRMDGYELASALRARPEFDSVPLLMLTSRAGEKHRQKALRLGVDRYLVKPCPEELLLAELRDCLKARRGGRLAAG
jgi:chemosensory pili system protein ChpA (sensor histidine kinase/response regulator)